MSLLADLLSKIKQPQVTREVPPNLKSIVKGSSRNAAPVNKIMVLSAVLLAAIVAGLFLVYFAKSISKSGAQGDRVKDRAVALLQERINKAVQKSPRASIDLPPNGPDAIARQSMLKGQIDEREKRREPSRLTHEAGEREKAGSGAAFVLENTPPPAARSAPSGRSTGRSAVAAFLYEAREHEISGDYAGALSSYKKVLEREHLNFAVQNSVAYCYLMLNLPEESIRHAEAALRVRGDYIPAMINLGIAHAKMKQYDRAEDYFVRAVGAEPENDRAILNLAILQERKMDYRHAAQSYTRLMQFGNIQGTIGLARIRDKEGRVSESLEFYKKAYNDPSLDIQTRASIKQRMVYLHTRTKNPESR